MEGHHESAFDPEHDVEHHPEQNLDHNAEQPQRQRGREEKEPFPYVLPLSIVMAAVIIGGSIMFTGRNDSGAPAKKAAAVEDALGNSQDFKSLEKNAPTLGSPDAPVAIVEFADFQCPFCGRFYQTTAKDIMSTYVKTGKARFIYRDFAFLGEESNWAAQAARCAGDQGKYWQYHDYLFEHQKGENQGTFTKDHLKSFALELGLNAGNFNTCLDSEKHKQEVESDTAMGKKFGVSGTPTTFVNGKLVQGAVPFETVKLTIEEALKGK